MIRRFKWIVLSGLVCLLFSSCSRKEYHLLSKVDKGMIPYKMGDTICYIDEDGLQSVFIVTEDCIKRKEFSNDKKPCVDVDVFEELWINAVSEVGKSYFSIRINKDDVFSFGHRTILLYWNQYINPFTIYYDSEGNFNSEENLYQYVYDSLEINCKMYYDVCLIIGPGYGDRQVLYNKDYGILQVRDGDKNVFSRTE